MIKTLLKLAIPLLVSNKGKAVDLIKARIAQADRDAAAKLVLSGEQTPGRLKFEAVAQYARDLLSNKSGLIVDTLVQILVFLAKG